MATRTVLVDSNVYLLQFTIKIQLIPPGTKSQGSVCWLKLSLLPLNTGPSTVLEEFLKRAISRKSLIPKPLLAVVPVRAEWVTFSNHMQISKYADLRTHASVTLALRGSNGCQEPGASKTLCPSTVP